jgi:phosphate-transporting ATPase
LVDTKEMPEAEARTALLRVEGLGFPGLAPASFQMPAGGILVLRGASGSGKSRLLRAIADLDPSEGQVFLDGAARDGLPAPAWRRKVCYLATESGWWAERVVDHFAGWEAIADRLDALGLPAECRDWPISRLSTGERQRLALLRALAVGPKVLLLDEPTGALDPAATKAVEALIAKLCREGLGVIWVTHDAEQAERLLVEASSGEKAGSGGIALTQSFRIAEGRLVPA